MNKKRFIKLTILVFLLVNTLLLSACGGGLAGLFDKTPGRQVFPPLTEDQEKAFTKWALEMREMNDVDTVKNISNWMTNNMKYAPGRAPLDWPGYQSWGHNVNCEGFAQVAIEALHRAGYDNYKLFVVYYSGGWHAVCASERVFTTNNQWGWLVGFNLTNAQIAAQIGDNTGHHCYRYQVFTRQLLKIDEGVPKSMAPIPAYVLAEE